MDGNWMGAAHLGSGQFDYGDVGGYTWKMSLNFLLATFFYNLGRHCNFTVSSDVFNFWGSSETFFISFLAESATFEIWMKGNFSGGRKRIGWKLQHLRWCGMKVPCMLGMWEVIENYLCKINLKLSVKLKMRFFGKTLLFLNFWHFNEIFLFLFLIILEI